MSDAANGCYVSPDDVETLVLDWGTMKILSGPGVTGAQRFSAGIAKIEPGHHHPVHSHSDVEEIIYVISGSGEQSVGPASRCVNPGDLVYVPPGAEHGTQNVGGETLVLLVVYSPPGPEESVREVGVSS